MFSTCLTQFLHVSCTVLYIIFAFQKCENVLFRVQQIWFLYTTHQHNPHKRENAQFRFRNTEQSFVRQKCNKSNKSFFDCSAIYSTRLYDEPVPNMIGYESFWLPRNKTANLGELRVTNFEHVKMFFVCLFIFNIIKGLVVFMLCIHTA